MHGALLQIVIAVHSAFMGFSCFLNKVIKVWLAGSKELCKVSKCSYFFISIYSAIESSGKFFLSGRGVLFHAFMTKVGLI